MLHDNHQPLALLGGLSPQRFMQRHWQKKPLLVRAAVAAARPLLDRAQLFELAAREEVESRLIVREGKRWKMRRGPLPRRALPPVSQRDWTLLVQGVDLHHAPARALLEQFRFIPDARLDDLMISWASDGGGVGPHFDSYDVFLLQLQGRRRWRIGRQDDLTLQQGVPLKILANFTAQDEYVLEPGDMLYLPPGYAHDGTALGECQTCSIGFRAPGRSELARELLQRLAEDADDTAPAVLYRDAGASPSSPILPVAKISPPPEVVRQMPEPVACHYEHDPEVNPRSDIYEVAKEDEEAVALDHPHCQKEH